MRKSMIITVIASVFSLAIIALSVTFGWFLNVNKTDAIDTTTKGIVFSYVITDGKTEKKDVSVYDVKNVAFFDIDSEYEGVYFKDMACCITLVYENVCDDDIEITLNFEPSNTEENSPYLDAVFSIEDLEMKESYKSVQNLLDDNAHGEIVVDEIAKSEKKTVYMYVFGVQPNDDANNDFFTSDIYGFKLTAKAVKKSEKVVSE